MILNCQKRVKYEAMQYTGHNEEEITLWLSKINPEVSIRKTYTISADGVSIRKKLQLVFPIKDYIIREKDYIVKQKETSDIFRITSSDFEATFEVIE